MPAIELTKDNFNDKVQNAPIAILDFWAPWCGPCRAFAPVFEAASDEHADILFGKVNTEQEQELAAYFQIRSIPTLMAIRDGIVVFSQAGVLPKAALDDLIRQVRELDMDKVRAEIADAEGQTSSN